MDLRFLRFANNVSRHLPLLGMPPINDIQWAQLVGLVIDELQRHGIPPSGLTHSRETRRIDIATPNGRVFTVSRAHVYLSILDPPFTPAADAARIVADFLEWRAEGEMPKLT
jgi:hypothetical protein